MPIGDPGALLYRDDAGQLVGLDEVLADGCDGIYADRHPALRRLLEHGEPVHRLHACVLLTAWGVREGLVTTAEWARAPDTVPWAGEPVSYDRFFGVDDGFAQLANGLRHAGDESLTEVGAMLRGAATRDLLVLSDRVYFDRSMTALLDQDPELAAQCRPEIGYAVETTTAAARVGDHPFDMATQAAFLLGPLARLDDPAAAAAAEVLVADHPDRDRTLREVAMGLSAGSGPATLAVLARLAGWASGPVRREAEQWLARRRVARDGRARP